MAKWLEKTLGEVTAFIAKGIPPKYTEKESEKTIRVLNQILRFRTMNQEFKNKKKRRFLWIKF